jgi:hypothetical protein
VYNDIVWSELGLVDDITSKKNCASYINAHGERAFWDSIQVRTPERSTLPFMFTWGEDRRRLCAQKPQLVSLFDDVQRFLEVLFNVLYYPDFRESYGTKCDIDERSAQVQGIWGRAAPTDKTWKPEQGSMHVLEDPFEL